MMDEVKKLEEGVYEQEMLANRNSSTTAGTKGIYLPFSSVSDLYGSKDDTVYKQEL